MNSSLDRISQPFIELAPEQLARTIFRAELPEQYVTTFPAQSLYMAIKSNGLSSSVDLIQIATIEQCRLLIDFDIWIKDEVNEKALFEWLSLTDETDDLELLQNVVKSIDLKLIALLISRYVQVEYFEEATDSPPAKGFTTPDKGRTWISINSDTSEVYFQLSRLLAMIFETNAELFYQLLAIATVNTSTVLEEEAYQDRERRLVSEASFPDSEFAASLNAPLSTKEALSFLEKNQPLTTPDVDSILPLVFQRSDLLPWQNLLSKYANNEAFHAELSLTFNAAAVYYRISFGEKGEIDSLFRVVRGAINLALEILLKTDRADIEIIYSKLGLNKIYRLGHSHIQSLKRLVHSKRNYSSIEMELIIFAFQGETPSYPTALNQDGTFIYDHDGKLSKEKAPLEHLYQLEALKSYLERIE
jgi:hypothetical protein